MRRLLRVAALGVVVLAGAAGISAARADGGEAGLVVEHGDGTVETYCITFTGDGIRGDELLRRAGVSFDQFGGLVCSLGPRPEEACPAASSFETCTCKCKGSDCVYWAFFTRSYGKEWVYSALGFAAQKAKDGDLQGWRWGKGSAMSAPAPVAVTFEQVCGHALRGGATVATPNVTVAPVAPPATGAASPAATATEIAAPFATVESAAMNTPGAELFTPSPATAPATSVSLPVAKTGDSGGGWPRGPIAFAAVAVALTAAIAAAWRWRGRGA